MKTTFIAACALTAAGMAAPAAQAGPFDLRALAAAQASQSKSNGESVLGFGCAGTLCVNFFAGATDDPATGTRTGSVSVQFFDGANFSIISCTGPQFVQSPNVIAVDKNKGNATVFAILDPAGPGCISDVPSPVVLNLTGQPSGQMHTSLDGVLQMESPGSRTKSNFHNDSWDLTINGSVGAATGAFSGTSQVTRSNDHVK